MELSITSEKNSRFGRNNCESLDNCCSKTDTDNTPVLPQRGTPCWQSLADHLKSEHLHMSHFNWIWRTFKTLSMSSGEVEIDCSRRRYSKIQTIFSFSASKITTQSIKHFRMTLLTILTLRGQKLRLGQCSCQFCKCGI